MSDSSTTGSSKASRRSHSLEPLSLRGVISGSLLAGLTPLIPFPFVDDWARNLMRRRLLATIGRSQGLRLGRQQLELLLGLGWKMPDASGCLLLVLRKLVLYPIVRLWRKILYFLTIKDAVDTASRCFHEAWLLRRAVQLGVVNAANPASLATASSADLARRANHQVLDPSEQQRRVRQAVLRVCDEVDPRPLEKALRRAMAGSGRQLRRAARHLSHMLRRSPEAERMSGEVRGLEADEDLIAPLTDRVEAELRQETSYLRHLEEKLEMHLQQLSVTPHLPNTPPNAAPTPAIGENQEV